MVFFFSCIEKMMKMKFELFSSQHHRDIRLRTREFCFVQKRLLKCVFEHAHTNSWWKIENKKHIFSMLQ